MKLQDYLHYYIGCKVMAAPYGGQQKRYEEGKLVGINVYDIAHVKLNNWQSVADISITCVKPILRRLEDMTEEEMIGLLQSMVPADMEDKPTNEDYDLEMFYNDDGLMVDADISVGANFTCGCFDGQIGVKKCGSIILFNEGEDVTRDMLINVPLAFHYLLQQHFDLFGLIDAGLAIDLKTTKEQ